MKKLITTVLFLALVFTGMAQTVRRVNNLPGITGPLVYATPQLAHDAAVANDILIIDPSSISYGELTLTKPLKIYGNGYFLNVNTELKVNTSPSTLTSIWFNTGSGGSEMYGVSASSVNIQGVSNITLSRNNMSTFNIYTYNKANSVNTNVSNIFFSRNYVSSTITPGSSAGGFTISSVMINNNLIGVYINGGSDPLVQNWVVRNNTFNYNGTSVYLVNSVLENNILMGGASVNITTTNVSASYNVSTGTATIAGIGNVSAYDVASDLQGTGAGISLDEQFKVKNATGLKTMGSSSSEVGAYGGLTPYIVSGIPAIPSIISMINSGTGNNATPIQVTISAKSNN
jgi:hypothetical protein